MKLYDDTPLINKNDDKLHRVKFSNTIVNMIHNLPKGSESIVIGLIGGWGTGKSTIINFCEEDFKNNQIKFFRFNPWNHYSQKYLYSAFFNELISTMNLGYRTKYKFIRYKKKIIKLGIDFISTFIPCIGKFNNYLTETEENTLDNLKKSLDEDLRKKDKTVVIIDDIDRLNPNEIKQIFQLVKSLANFPNIIYILAFDEKYVNHALKDWNPNNQDYSYSEDFIDKIVQIPIKLPKFNDEDLKKIFFSKFDLIIENHSIDDNHLNRARLYNLLKPFFISIRHINRYCNILDFYLYSISENIDIYDFSLIISLQIFTKDTYELIKNNGEILTGTYVRLTDTKILKMNNTDLEQLYDDLLKDIGKNKKNIDNIIKELFPKIKNLNAKQYQINKTYDNDFSRARIMFSDYFDLYFSYDVIENIITKSQLSKIVNSSTDEENLKKEFFSIIEKHEFISILYYLSRLGSEYNDKMIFNLINVITKNYEELFIQSNIDIILSNHFIAVSEYLFDIIKKSKIEHDSLYKFINTLEINYFMIYFVWYITRQDYFNDNQKNSLSNKFCLFIENSFKNKNMDEIKNPQDILGFWKDFSKNNHSLNKYLMKITDEDLLFILSNAVNISQPNIEEIIDEIKNITTPTFLYKRFKKIDVDKLSERNYIEFINNFIEYYEKNYGLVSK